MADLSIDKKVEDSEILVSSTPTEKAGCFFNFHRFIIVFTVCAAYVCCSFFNTSIGILSQKLIDKFGCTASELSRVDSVTSITAAVVQPFSGILADRVSPTFLIGTACLFSSLCFIINSYAKNTKVLCLGCFCSGISGVLGNMSTLRLFTQWFHTKYNSILTGLYIGIGTAGNIVGQLPLAAFIKRWPWEYAYRAMSVFAGFISILMYIFIRGSPESYGYPHVEGSLPPPQKVPMKDFFGRVFSDIVVIFTNIHFWLVCLLSFITAGMNSCNGLWSNQYFMKIYKYSEEKVSYIALPTTIVTGLTNFFAGSVSDLVKSRKWVIFSVIVIFFTMCLVISFKDYFTFWQLCLIFSLASIAFNSVFPLWIRDILKNDVVVTAFSFVNSIAFLGVAIFKLIFSGLYGSFGKNHSELYQFQYGIFLPAAITAVIANILCALMKDGIKFKREKEIVPDKSTETEGSVINTNLI